MTRRYHRIPGWDDGAIYCGLWEDVAQGIEVDAVITDPPYSPRTHLGHDASARQRKQMRGQKYRAIDYAAWDTGEVTHAVEQWHRITLGWIVSMCDDWLTSDYRRAYERVGRYSFAPVHWISFRPRLMGDGPTNCATYIMCSRPRSVEFSRWGCLDGYYMIQQDRDAKIGGKPLALMRMLVRHYSKPGDLVFDPCMGHGTTGVACKIEGRRFLGCEIDPDSYERAVERLARPVTERLPLPDPTLAHQEDLF